MRKTDAEGKCLWCKRPLVNRTSTRSDSTVKRVERDNASAPINRHFPSRPTAAEIEREYTPERVMRLARYVAAKRRFKNNQEQFEEDVQQCVLSVYTRINDYNEGRANIPPSYPFYHWLLFHVRTDLRDARRKESRSLGTRRIVAIHPGMVDSKALESNVEDKLILKIDVEGALDMLTPRMKQVVELYYKEHLSQQEIADKIGVSQPRVAQLLQKAEQRLEATLGDRV